MTCHIILMICTIIIIIKTIFILDIVSLFLKSDVLLKHPFSSTSNIFVLILDHSSQDNLELRANDRNNQFEIRNF